MRGSLHLAILRSAAVLVPREQRVEWLAEWRGELWHVRQECGTAFCLGAYKDAFWLRRNRPCGEEHSRLESPAHCLMLLTALAALSWLAALLVPDIRTAMVHSKFVESLKGLLSVTGLACVIVTVTSRRSRVEYPATANSPSRMIRLRRWLFLAAKVALLLSIVYCWAFPLFAFASRIDRAVGILVNLLVWACALAFHWILRDQRKRCPVCLRLLADPVRVGRPSGYFLEWNCMELVCRRGHGLLYVPECRTSWFNAQRWFYLEP